MPAASPSASGNALTAPPAIGTGPDPSWVVPPTVTPDPTIVQPGEPAFVLLNDIQAYAPEQTYFRRLVTTFGSPQGAGSGSRLEVVFQPLFEKLTVHHVTLVRDGEPIDRTQETAFHSSFLETDVERRNKDGRVAASALIEDIRVGDTLDFAYSIEQHTAPLAGEYHTLFEHLGGSHPTRSSRVRVTGLPGRDLYFRSASDVPAPDESEQSGSIVLTWEFADIPANPVIENAPTWHQQSPWIQTTTFESWGDVATTLAKSWKNACTPDPDPVGNPSAPALSAAVAKIREQALGDPAEAARLALSFVQDSIHNHHSGAPVGVLAPASPEQTLARRIGDALDRSALLCAILRHLGATSKPVLVNRTLRERVSSYLPSPELFDHAIVEVRLGGSTLWVDPTLAEQGGTLRHRSLPEYHTGLPIDTDARDLTTIRSGSSGEDRIEVLEHYFLAHRSLDPTVTARTLATGAEADVLRSAVHAQGSSRAASLRAGRYTALYPGSVRKGSPQEHTEEPYGLSSYALTDTFHLPNFGEPDASGESVLFPCRAHLLLDGLPAEAELGRTAPLAIDHPKRLQQTIEIEANGIGKLPVEPTEIKSPAFHFTLETDTRLTGAELRYSYESLADHVKPSDLAAHNSALAELRPLLKLTIPIPLARGFAFKHKGAGPVVPRGASRGSRSALAGRKTGLPSGLAPLTQLRDVDSEGEAGLGSIEDDSPASEITITPAVDRGTAAPNIPTGRNIDSDTLASEQGAKMDRWRNATPKNSPLKLGLLVALGTALATGIVVYQNRPEYAEGGLSASSVASYSTIEQDKRFLAASEAAGQKDFATASTLLEDVAKTYPGNPDLATLRATFALEQGDVESGIQIAREAVTGFPNHAQANAVLGRAILASGERINAIEYLEKALSLNSSLTAAQRELAAIYAREGRSEDSEALYKRVISAEPDDTDSILALANIYETRGNRLLAHDTLEEAHREFPTNATLANTFARYLYRQGDIQNAIYTAERSLSATGQNLDTLKLLAKLHEEAGNAKSAAAFRSRVTAAIEGEKNSGSGG